MITREPLELPFEYMDTPERRVLNLEPEGIPCIPVLGLSHYRKNWAETDLHIHPECLEFSFCQRGQLSFELNGKKYPFRPGSIVFSRPDEPHRLTSYPKGLFLYWFFFRIPPKNHYFLGLPADEATWLRKRFLSLPKRLFDGNNHIRGLFQKLFWIYDTIPTGTPQRALLFRNTVTDLILSLIEASENTPKIIPSVRIKNLIAQMREHPEAHYPLDKIAMQTALSTTNLIDTFKRETGLPPHAFLVHCRILKAKAALQEGKQSIAELADTLGFSTAQHFASTFRQETGVTPSAYRQRKKGRTKP